MIEGTDIIIVSVVFAVPLSIFLWFSMTKNNKTKTPKSMKEQLETVSVQNFRAAQESYEIQIKRLKDDNLSLTRANSRMKGIIEQYKNQQIEINEETQEEDSLSDYDIDWVKAAQVGAQLGLDTQRFDPNNPALTKYIADKILEHKDLALFLGIIKPKGFRAPNIPADQTSLFNSQSTPSFESL